MSLASLTSGDCTLNLVENCVCSPNFSESQCDDDSGSASSDYAGGESCRVTFKDTVKLTAHVLATESAASFSGCYDYVMVPGYEWGQRYCRNGGVGSNDDADQDQLDGITATSIGWTTDSVTHSYGFKVCFDLLSPPPSPPPPSPSPPPQPRPPGLSRNRIYRLWSR